ncbi:MAG TPA: DUF4350 domain-containing protein [Sphingomonadaceae bacterium]
MTATAASPFSPRALLAMLVLGAIAFIATLYLVGASETGGDFNDGGGHAAAKGLNGFAGFAALLEKQGYRVSLSRSQARYTERALLVLTPAAGADADELNRIIRMRRYAGPTLVILPKWFAVPLPTRLDVRKQPGWVQLVGAATPSWAADLMDDKALKPQIQALKGAQARWSGIGMEGRFPDPQRVLSAVGNNLVPLVSDGAGRTLAGYWDDTGRYPALDAAADVRPPAGRQEDRDAFPVVIVAEPDLLDNYGLADQNRALLATALVKATMDGSSWPVTFDLTLNGLGASKNLLTLAFSPPFLAATLCLILAALVIGWRGYRRFGPPLAEVPAFAFGKRQLAVNGAALIQRSRRLHLLGAPYAAMLRARLAGLLGLRQASGAERDEAEIDRLLEARGLPPHAFSNPAETLRRARGSHDLLRSAQALKELEGSLSP